MLRQLEALREEFQQPRLNPGLKSSKNSMRNLCFIQYIIVVLWKIAQLVLYYEKLKNYFKASGLSFFATAFPIVVGST